MGIIIIIFFIVIIGVVIWQFSTIIALFWTHVPFVKTPKNLVKLVLDNLELKGNVRVVELGCGDARFLRAAEKQCSKCNLIGYEVSFVAYLSAQVRIFFQRSKVQVKLKSFYRQDLSQADLIYCYLWPSIMAKLAPKLEKELKPGAQVVSLAFPIKTWKPYKVIDTKIKGRGKLYFYTFPITNA